MIRTALNKQHVPRIYSIHTLLILDAQSPLRRRIHRKMTAPPRPAALMISMTKSGLAYLCPLSRCNVSPFAVPSPRFSLFPCGSSPRAPLDGAAILAHTPGKGGEERRRGSGEAGPGGIQEVRWMAAASGETQGYMDGSICVTLRRIVFKGKHLSICRGRHSDVGLLHI